MKSRSVVDLITSGVDVSGADEYCRPGPSTKTATITGSSATRTPDFLRNLIAPPILVLTNDQEKRKKKGRKKKKWIRRSFVGLGLWKIWRGCYTVDFFWKEHGCRINCENGAFCVNWKFGKRESVR